MSNLVPTVKVPNHLDGGPEPGARTVQRAFGGSSGMLGLRTNFRGRATIQSPYRESGWVHACMKPRGQAVAQVPVEFWTANPAIDKQAKKLPADHPLCRTFRSPNPLHTQAQFFEACALHRGLDGLDLWLLMDASGKPLVSFPEKGEPKPIDPELEIPIPAMIMPFRGRMVAYTTDARGWPTQYQITQWGGGAVRVPPQTVLILRDYDPDNPIGGLSDVDAALSEIDLDWQAQRYQRALLENSGDPGGYVKIDGQLAQPEEAALKNEVKQQFSIERAGEWRVLTGKNLEYIPYKNTPRDMEFHQLQSWTRDKIAAILGVPPPVIGVLDNATLANFEQAIRLFWLGGNGVLAYVKSVEDVINGHFLPRLRKDRTTPETVYARFDTSGVRALQENKQLQLDIASKLVGLLRIGADEALKLVGIESEPLRFGKNVLVPSSLVPIESVISGDTLPDATADPKKPDDTGDDEDPASEPDPAEDSEKAATPVTRGAEAPAEDEALKARSVYWEQREAAYARAGRAEVKRRYIRWSKRLEAAYLKRLREFAKKGPAALRSTKRDILDDILDPLNLDPRALDPLLVDQAQWAKNMRTTLEVSIRDVFEEALLDMAQELDVDPIGIEAPRVIHELEAQLLQLVEGHTSVLAERVREALLHGLETATSTGTLQELVLEVLPALEGSLKQAFADREGRALTIARTEVGTASSTARDMQMREGGVTTTEWISSRDQAVRGTPGGPYEDAQFSHYELDGKAAAIGTEFDPTNHPGLTRPHDPNAQAGDSVNCRCYARPKKES